MNPESARTEAQIYLRDFESEIPTTISLLRSIPAGNLSYKPDPKSNTGLALCRHIVLQRVKERTGEELARDIELFGVYKMPAVGYLSMALRHSIHHRGQLTAYTRAMGGKVPAIYGPSADSVGT